MKERHCTRAVRTLVVAVLAFVVIAVPSVALAHGRVALVLDNSTNARIGRLPNPENHAADTATLRAFTRRSTGADVPPVFYMGHGIEIDGVNYLDREVNVRLEKVTVDELILSTSGASLRLLILDGYRNNPLAPSMHRTAATGTVSAESFADLGDDLLRNQALLTYPAAARTTAADGPGPNSPYPAALFSQLDTPLQIGLLFRLVPSQALARTNGEQPPHEYQHYVTPTLPTAVSASESVAVSADPVPPDPPTPDPPDTEIAALRIAARHALADVGDAEAQAELGGRCQGARPLVADYPVPVPWLRRSDRSPQSFRAACPWLPAAAELRLLADGLGVGGGHIATDVAGRHISDRPMPRPSERLRCDVCGLAVLPNGCRF